MKRTILLSAIALTALYFSSCNNAGTSAGATSPTDSTTTGVSDPNRYHGGGHSVPWGYIQPCIQAYADTMARYGINSDSPRQKMTHCPDSTYMITTSEYFRADSLMAYLKQQIAIYDPKGHGANLNFVIYPGIRTAPMLTYTGTATSSAGRITFFIVPDTTGPSGMKTMPKGGGGGGSGFEVGSIQP
ncbi:MAG TPA: hypothetical protein VHE34_09580 [Puia sp.]|uniref:hypothetical protein n=1 Tax=Puia sp. TaxID=2045100 RepID=UPI002CF7DFCF|nr:hypothetical protein [Puia sp.]HVU95465.1 hypothetical protein [Puia sp.]